MKIYADAKAVGAKKKGWGVKMRELFSFKEGVGVLEGMSKMTLIGLFSFMSVAFVLGDLMLKSTALVLLFFIVS